MAEKNDFTEQKIDFVIEQAVAKYANYIEKELDCNELEKDLTSEEIAIMEKQEKVVAAKIAKKMKDNELTNYKRKTKIVAVLVAILICTFGVMTNATALRTFLYKTYVDTKGTIIKLKTNVDYVEDYSFITNFCEIEEVIVPGWLPADIEITKKIDNEAAIQLQFESEDMLVTLYEELIFQGKSSANIETENNTFVLGERKVLGMKAQVTAITSELGKQIYTVTWNSDKVRYTLTADCSKIMLDTIIENLKYL